MKEIKLWQFIKAHLERDEPIIIMAVVDSEYSSPGRAGFKMAVSRNKEMFGSIGGGIMEYNLVEDAIQNLKNSKKVLHLKTLYHSGEYGADRSGMICSGKQTIFKLKLQKKDLVDIEKIIDAILNDKNAAVRFNNEGFSCIESNVKTKQIVFNYEDEQNWNYEENIGQPDTIYIIGGGHVGLALSKVMSLLGFYIVIIDDRPELQTIQLNTFADERIIINYDAIDNYLREGDHSYIAIVTHTHESDKLILQKVITKNFKYIGLMGSKAKVKNIFAELKQKAIGEETIKNIHSPIGIEINSQTPEEIAISIAAEIIKIRNS